MSMDRFPTFRRLGRWSLRILRRTGQVLLVLIVILAIAWTYFNLKYGRELELEVARWRAQGEPLTYAEIAPRPVPDSENAAVVYQQVFQVHFPHGTGIWQAPEPGVVRPPGFAGLTQAELGKLANFACPRSSSYAVATEAEVATWLARSGVVHALKVFEEGSRRPACVFPVNWQDGPGALFPHLSRFRSAVQLLAAQALLESRRGRRGAAIHWLAVGVRMCRQVGTEPILIAQLVRFSMLAILIHPTGQEVLCETKAISPQISELAETLAAQDVDTDFHTAMSGERAMNLWLFEFVNSQPLGKIRSLLREGEGLGMNAVWLALYTSPFGRPLRKHDILAFLHFWDLQAAAMDHPFRESKARFDALERNSTQFKWIAPLTSYSFPTYGRATKKRDWAKAEIALWRVALALKGYKFAHGRYPATLADLQRTLDWTIPDDVFSGRPFIYRTEGAGFVVYSIGPDLKDDGGKSQYDEQGKYHEEGDIVWRCGR
ncbi:MAG: hypothetical protein GX100_13060 [candidate division WS1 bacterium]|nr:hypothetical protein [candidate division WS1 bacterium]